MSFWKHRGIGRGVAAVVVAALVATLVVASPAAAQDRQLSFGDVPTGWSITSGEADANVGKVAATGVKKNRIRYATSTPGFAVTAKKGVVSYDGTAIAADTVLVSVVARDRKGKLDDATVTITISVSQASSETPLEQVFEAKPDPQPHSGHVDHPAFHRPKYPTGLRVICHRTSPVHCSRQVTLSWNNPRDRDRPIITKYQYQYQQNGGDWMDWTDMEGSDSSTTSYVVEGLTNGEEYIFRIRSFYSDSIQSRASTEIKATPKLEISHMREVRRYFKEGERYGRPAGYQLINVHAPPYHRPAVYEGQRKKKVTWLEANDHSTRWSIDQKSIDNGFVLQFDTRGSIAEDDLAYITTPGSFGSDADARKTFYLGQTTSDGKAWTESAYMILEYNGGKWLDKWNGTITLTGLNSAGDIAILKIDLTTASAMR